ncbi:MAG: class I SAM-dependent methyltransferase [Rhodospirillales bacterium]|nr:class I SAM-dependent methyltransferase [Rhodospirillales bacterium]
MPLPFTKCSRRIRAIVSTTNIPELDRSLSPIGTPPHRGWGPYSTPITPLQGSFLHADPQIANHDQGGTTFFAGDGVTLPVADASVDFAWSYECFQHMPSHELQVANLREIRRVLRPGGRAQIHFRTGHAYPAALRWLTIPMPTRVIASMKSVLGKDPLTSDPSWRGARLVSADEIRGLAHRAGLRLDRFCADPTHAPGTRLFALLRPR